MRLSLAAACLCLLFVLPATSQSKSEQDNTTDRAQVVSTAEITKVDAKKQTVKVKEVVQPTSTGRRTGSGGGGGGRRGGGGGAGGAGRRRGGGGGGGFPGGGSGGGYPGGNGGQTTSQVKQFTVFVTKDTVMKLANADIGFSDLHVGDRVAISGVPKGSKGDIEATAISRID